MAIFETAPVTLALRPLRLRFIRFFLALLLPRCAATVPPCWRVIGTCRRMVRCLSYRMLPVSSSSVLHCFARVRFGFDLRSVPVLFKISSSFEVMFRRVPGDIFSFSCSRRSRGANSLCALALVE